MTYKKRLAILCVAVLVISSFMSLTYAEKVISTHGELKTQGVDISIAATQDNKLIAPNMTVKYEPVITYKGVDSYVRFKLDISTSDIALYQFTGLNSDWVQRGEYFYYKKPVKHNTRLSTFKSFHVPSEYDELDPKDFMGSKFNITATCDAVQAKNFTPDFDNDKPWGNLSIQDNDYDGNTYAAENNNIHDKIRLNFETASQYSLSSDQMVKNTILPGDTYKNSIVLSNSGKKNMKVFFSVSKENQEEMYNLLDALKLTIKLDGKDFYEGTLRASRLNDWKTLLTLEKGSKHTLSYEIHAPAELDNAYEEKLNHFTWNFKVRELSDAPVTGDQLNLIFWLVTMALSALILILILKGARVKNEE